jgi:hypothetical protein
MTTTPRSDDRRLLTTAGPLTPQNGPQRPNVVTSKSISVEVSSTFFSGGGI